MIDTTDNGALPFIKKEVRTMAAKMLDEVLLKEKQAAEKENEAVKQGNITLESAREKAKEILDNAEKEAEALERSKIAEATEKAEKAVAEASKEAEKYAELLKAKADAKFSEAVGVVRDIIVG